MSDSHKVIVGAAVIGGLFLYYHHATRSAVSVTAGQSFQNRYTIDPNTAVALGIGQQSYGGPSVVGPYPSDAFDQIYENTFTDSQSSAYYKGLFDTYNKQNGAMGLPVFTGNIGSRNKVVLFDPRLDKTYGWDPETNSLLSGVPNG
ncbi:MAG: hypothetical protein JSR64_17045 [Nitrospira sp.]|nr:hypothetical protein [Nitrospira sp.]